MGSLPLHSVGWQGFPNDEKGNPHPLITQHKGYLFQRMLARNTPCGIAPESKTPFGRLPDGKPFWDDEGDEYQSSGFVYPDPPHWQTVFINAEEVPEPIKANELSDFDKTRVGAEHGPQENGWGERDPKLVIRMTILTIISLICIPIRMSLLVSKTIGIWYLR